MKAFAENNFIKRNSVIFFFYVFHFLLITVRTKIGPFAQPDFIQNAPGLPKTRSGKIMRRILRKIAVDNKELGDISTLADETVIETLFKLRPSSLS